MITTLSDLDPVAVWAGVIVLGALAILTGLSIVFSGAIHF